VTLPVDQAFTSIGRASSGRPLDMKPSLSGSSMGAVHFEWTAHPVPLGGVSADQRGCVVRGGVEPPTFRFSGQPRLALCRPAKTDVTGKRTALGGRCRIKANRGRYTQSTRQAGRGIQQSCANLGGLPSVAVCSVGAEPARSTSGGRAWVRPYLRHRYADTSSSWVDLASARVSLAPVHA
jgi:hypothetical protein